MGEGSQGIVATSGSLIHESVGALLSFFCFLFFLTRSQKRSLLSLKHAVLLVICLF